MVYYSAEETEYLYKSHPITDIVCLPNMESKTDADIKGRLKFT